MWQDIRDAIRSYRKAPAFTAVALLTLTLAIGANTAIFSLLNALVLRNLPVRDPSSLVQLSSMSQVSNYESGLTFPMFQRVSARADLFSAVIGWMGISVMNVETERERTQGAIWVADGQFFSELGLRPFAGRALSPDDVDQTTLQPAPVALIGYKFWQSHFGGDPAVIGQRIRVKGQPFTIVGIGPRGFTGLGWIFEPDVMLPLTAWPLINDSPLQSIRNGSSFFVRTTARLKPGVTLAQAKSAIEAEWPELKRTTVPPGYTPAQRDRFLATRLVVRSAANGVEQGLRNKFAQPLVIVFGIAALILLIACVNLASLMLSRAAARSHEIGVRLALGAGRWRVARQMLLEGVVLSAAGAACGIGFAYWISRAIVAQILHDYLVEASLNVAPDVRVLMFASALAVLVGVLFSLAPALRATRLPSLELLQKSTRTASVAGRTGRLLVVVQIALSLVLLINAGLLVRTLQQIRAVDSGMRADDVLVAYPGELPGGYTGINNDAYYPQVVERLQSVPGVSRVAVSTSKPAGGGGLGEGERVSSVNAPADATGIASLFTAVSPAFFDTLGVALRTGRDFSWGDNSHANRVAIVSETLARRLFPNGSAIGQHVRIGVVPRRQNLEIVGVVSDARIYNLKDPNAAALYAPALQEPDASYKCFVIRANGVSLADLNRAVDSLGREHIGSMRSIEYITNEVLLQERLTAGLAAFFGGLALLLAGIGLYGLMAYGVAQRRREIGIRVALGAEPRRVMADVVRDSVAVALGGVAIGFVAALATVQLVKSLLFGVTPHDPVTLFVAPASLIAIAIAASMLPAARAARVDPMVALRAE
jgi:predicted permease